MAVSITVRHRQERHRAYRLLYDAVWSDGAISRVTSTAISTVALWQEHESLGANIEICPGKIDNVRALSMYREGANDAEIGKAFGATQSSATRWRYRHGLPSNWEPRINSALKKSAAQMLSRGASRRQVSSQLDTGHLSTMTKIRAKLRSRHLRQRGIINPTIKRRELADSNILPRIRKAIGSGMPDDVKHDAVFDLYADVLEGLVDARLIESLARSYKNKAFEICGSKFGPKSLYENWKKYGRS